MDKGWEKRWKCGYSSDGRGGVFFLSLTTNIRETQAVLADGQPRTSIFNYYLRTNGGREEFGGGREMERGGDEYEKALHFFNWIRPAAERPLEPARASERASERAGERANALPTEF